MVTSPKELSDVYQKVHECSKDVCDLTDKIDARIAKRMKKREEVIKSLQKESIKDDSSR